jgi:hypothetical protein
MKHMITIALLLALTGCSTLTKQQTDILAVSALAAAGIWYGSGDKCDVNYPAQ